MASSKEAIAIVLDVGPSMNQAPDGRRTSLETAKNAVNMILQRKLFSESKDEVCLVLFGTPETANDLSEDGMYRNITLARPLGPTNWELIKFVEDDIKPSNISADFVDACIVSMDHLMKEIGGKKGFGIKRLILFTDAGGEFGDDQIEDVIGGIKENGFDFNVIGPNLDDGGDDDDDDEEDDDDDAAADASANHRKPLTSQQRAGNAMLRHIINEVDGECYSFEEALPMLSYYQSRSVRPTAWKCCLDISSQLSIPLAGYIKVKESKPKTFKNVYAKDPVSKITRLRTSHLNDDAETEIEREEVINGYRYGRTLVPFSEEDKEAMKLETQKCLKVLGFTKSNYVKPSQYLGEGCMVFVGEPGDEVASVALSALVNALDKSDMVAIVRRVYAKNAAPKLGCLVPHIKSSYECFYYHELPFAEDVRQYTFGSLPIGDKVNDNNKRIQPTDDQMSAMDEFIDSMDLCKNKESDDEDELLKPKHTFNPYLQRLYQCLQHRALHQDDPLPAIAETIKHSLEPPKEVVSNCTKTLEKISQVFKLEQRQERADQTGQNMFSDDSPVKKKPKIDENGMNKGMADISKANVKEVGSVNPVSDFQALVENSDRSQFSEASAMLEARIQEFVDTSFGSQLFGKAMDCIKCYRKEAIRQTNSESFNTFLKKYQDNLDTSNKSNFWKLIAAEHISLIDKSESEDSSITKQEAQDFISETTSAKLEEKQAPKDEDEDDLFDQL